MTTIAMGGRIPAAVVPVELEDALRAEALATGVYVSVLMRKILEKRYSTKPCSVYHPDNGQIRKRKAS